MCDILLRGVQVHGEKADDEVGEGQAQQIVVVDRLQLAVHLKRQHHQNIPDNRDEADDGGDGRYGDHLPQTVCDQVDVRHVPSDGDVSQIHDL